MIDADPYPWPYDGDVDGARLALLVAGASRVWADRSVGVGSVSACIGALGRAVRSVGGVVVHVRHDVRTRRPLPFVGAADDELVVPVHDTDVVVVAAGIDGFYGSPLDALLRARGITHLLLTGFGAEATVDSTLRSANDRGYECLSIIDAVAPFDADVGAHALASVTMSGGIFGAIAMTEAVLAELAPAPSLQEAL